MAWKKDLKNTECQTQCQHPICPNDDTCERYTSPINNTLKTHEWGKAGCIKKEENGQTTPQSSPPLIIKDKPEPDIPIYTDYTKQQVKEYRKRMIGRYSYLFQKPYNELQDFEKGLYWYLKIECYDALTSVFNEDDVMCWEQIRRLENKADTIVQELKIPYELIDTYSIIEKSTDRKIIKKKVGFTSKEMDVYQ